MENVSQMWNFECEGASHIIIIILAAVYIHPIKKKKMDRIFLFGFYMYMYILYLANCIY